MIFTVKLDSLIHSNIQTNLQRETTPDGQAMNIQPHPLPEHHVQNAQTHTQTLTRGKSL